MTIAPDATDLQGDLVQLRRALHREAEVGLHLPSTQELVLEALQGLPLEVTTGMGLSSVTAVLRGRGTGPRSTVLLRGDMDALPLQERTGVSFAAPGEVMHACGHDLHTTMLVGAARLLASARERLSGDVVFMFQPGEENDDGAAHMIEEGVLDAAGFPDAAYALHVSSAHLPSGVFSSRPGTLLAAEDAIRVTVRGVGGHGSAPHRAADPIPVACEMVGALQTFVTRSFDIFDPVVATVGVLRAGTAINIIPDEAYFEATIRSFSAVARERVVTGAERLFRGIAAAHGVEIDVDVEVRYPVTENDPAHVELASTIVKELLGDERYVPLPNPLAGAEDFSRVLQRVPGAMVFLGATAPGRDPDKAPSNHSPLAAFDEAVLGDGARLLAALAQHQLVVTRPPQS